MAAEVTSETLGGVPPLGAPTRLCFALSLLNFGGRDLPDPSVDLLREVNRGRCTLPMLVGARRTGEKRLTSRALAGRRCARVLQLERIAS